PCGLFHTSKAGLVLKHFSIFFNPTFIVLSSRGKASPAFAHLDVEVDPSLFNVDMFMAGLSSSGFMAYNSANPEQYVKRTSPFEITESFGGKITSFSMPDFGPGGKRSFMATLPQFPFNDRAGSG
ncbi:hypothetical protein IWW34DRAFT_642357, partial [Fusarium oxysporum f. sp. albedinis]